MTCHLRKQLSPVQEEQRHRQLSEILLRIKNSDGRWNI